jgi:hypothetical protein
MYIYSSFAERYVLVQVVSRFRDLIGEDVVNSSSSNRSSIGSLLFALDRTIFYSVPFKVPALNRVTGGGPYTLVKRHRLQTVLEHRPIHCEPVLGSLGKGGYSSDRWDIGTSIRTRDFRCSHSRAIPDSIYGFISGNSDTFGIHQFGRRLSTTILLVRPSSPVTSDTWLVWSFYIPICRSFYDITVPTERGIDEPERNVDV